jgi:hypothetical protein
MLLPTGESYRVVPTTTVDAVWHTALQDTEPYAAACQAIAGEFVHHRPIVTEEIRNGTAKAYTMMALRGTGYAIDKEFWDGWVRDLAIWTDQWSSTQGGTATGRPSFRTAAGARAAAQPGAVVHPARVRDQRRRRRTHIGRTLSGSSGNDGHVDTTTDGGGCAGSRHAAGYGGRLDRPQ